MNNRDYIPRKDEAFHAWQEQFIGYLLNKLSEYGLTPQDYYPLTAAQTAWSEAYEKVRNAATRTPLAVQVKKDARPAYEDLLRAFVRRRLINNPAVTNVEREGLGLPVYKTGRTPAPRPATYPDYEIDSSMIRQLTIHFHDRGATRRAKPAGVHGAEIRWEVCEEPSVSETALRN